MAEKDNIQKQTEDIYQKYYTQQNDPAKAGSDAFRRAVSSQLRQSYEQEAQTAKTYSDLYQQARAQATRRGAMSNISGFGGGRAEGAQARISAAEIAALSGIAGQREGAIRGIQSQREAIPSNALIEAQQADQFTRAMETANRARTEEIFNVIGAVKNYAGLSNKQKAQLKAYGITDEKSFSDATMIPMQQIEAITRRQRTENAIGPTGEVNTKALQEYFDMLRKQEENK